MNIFILTVGSFPKGMAATNRLLSYAKGLIELGHNVNVLILAPDSDTASKNPELSGEYLGIKYSYTCKTNKWPSNSLLKLITILKGLYQAIKEIHNYNKKKPVHAILILFTFSLLILPVITYSRLKHIKVFHERTEFPSVTIRETVLNKLLLQFYLSVVCPLFDGIYIISNPLKEYFISNNINSNDLYVFPMIVDPTRFSTLVNVDGLDETDKYIAYCGVMDGNKDGVKDLIEAFSLIESKFPHIKLYLIGSAKPGEHYWIEQKINNTGLKDRIILTGEKSRDEVPILLKKAILLVLARPNSIQSKGGFPTKLGEYLATGVPVVVTKVGEIPKYLKDGLNAFLSEPGNPWEFATKMDYALSNPSLASAIGKKGKELVETEFNYLVQTQKLEKFFVSKL